MATFLHRLGRWCADRRWAVVVTWLALLALTGVSALTFMKPLSNQFSIPGSRFESVLSTLRTEIPAAAGVNGTVVFSSDAPFTPAQEQAIARLTQQWGDLEGVRTNDPFAAQRSIDKTPQDLADARQKLADGRQQLADGEKKLATSRTQLADGEKKLAAGEKKLEASRTQLADGQQQWETGQAQWQAGQTKWQQGEAQWQAGQTKWEQGYAQWQAGQAQLDGQRQQLEAGIAAGQVPPAQAAASRAQLDAAQQQLTASKQQLDAGRAQLDATRQQLDAGKAKLDASAQQLATAKQQLDAGQAQLAAGEKKLEDSRAQLEEGKAKLKDGEQQIVDNRAKLEQGEKDLAAGQRVADLTHGVRMVNQAGTVAMTQVSVDHEHASGGNIDPELTAQLKSSGAQLQQQTGVQVHYSKEITQDLNSVFGPGESVGLIVAGLVLLVMLGSLVAAGLPILMAIVGVGVGLAGAMALSPLFDMQSITPVLALMLGLAVGIDYSLFLINRHRENLRHGMPLRESIALAVGTSGNAVTFAGLTVIIALAALTLTGIPFIGIMGLVAAATVAVAVLVAITLTPAFLSIIGMRVLPRRMREQIGAGDQHEVAEHDAREADTRRGWAAVVQRHRWLAIVAVLAVVAGLGWPVGQLRLGLPDGGSEPAGSSAYTTYDTVRQNFGAGANGPIIAVATLDQPVAAGDTALHNRQADIGEQLKGLAGVQRVIPFGVNDGRTVLAFQVQPEGGPAEASTVDLVHEIDSQSAQIGQATGSKIEITGMTVANIDISETLAGALPTYLAVVVGLSLVLLLLVFRSIPVPLLATAGFLLSILAAFGGVVAVYQLGHFSSVFQVNEPGPILSFLPVLLIGILFGLAMDYQVFLVSAIREMHVHGRSARDAVVTGFNHSARVVTAAAIIMVSVFAGFVWAKLAMIRPMGLGLAIGVLVDAFLVRMTLTPAVLSLLGEKAWWIPRWLDRILPDVDVEGAKLERSTPHPAAEATAEPERAQEVGAEPAR